MRTSTLLVLLAACGGNGSTPAARQATIEFFTAGPAGGVFAVGDGIEIEIPPDALGGPTEFRYERLDPDQLEALPVGSRAARAFHLSAEASNSVASPQLAMEDPPLTKESIEIRASATTSVGPDGGEQLPIELIARITPEAPPEILDEQKIRKHEQPGSYEVAGKTSHGGTFVVLFGFGTVEYVLVEEPTPGIRVQYRRDEGLDGSIEISAGDSTISDGDGFIEKPEPRRFQGKLIEESPFLAAFFGIACHPDNPSFLGLIKSVVVVEDDVLISRGVAKSLTRIEAPILGRCKKPEPGSDRDGNWAIRFAVTLLEGIRLIPEGWLDTDVGRHLLVAYAEGISVVSVFNTVQDALNYGTGGLTGVLLGAFVLADPSADRSLAQLSQPNPQTVVFYGSGGGFIRKYTPGQGFAPLTISLGAQFTDGSPMDNDPLSGIGVITNNIGNNFRVISGSASGALPAGVPGQVSPRGFPAGTGKLFCTFMRTTAKTLVVTQGNPGAVWFVKDLLNPVVTKLADTQDDPRRIRVCGDIVVISNFGSNTLSIYRWNQDDTFTFIKHEPVCNGPVGFDLKKLTDGRVAIVSTGFFDHKYAITVVDPIQLTVKSGPCTALIAGCEDPGHAIWVPDEDEHRIVASCNGTENLASMAVTIPE